MNEEQIRKGLKSGKLHPFPLLQHLAKEGDEEGTRLVASLGPKYVSGTERLRFRSLVREIAPGTLAAEDAQKRAAQRRKQEERSRALGSSLRAKVAAEREKREGRPVSSGAGGGWNLPLDVPK
jgi:hypothetical protein